LIILLAKVLDNKTKSTASRAERLDQSLLQIVGIFSVEVKGSSFFAVEEFLLSPTL
jgi:hypothetical protein